MPVPGAGKLNVGGSKDLTSNVSRCRKIKGVSAVYDPRRNEYAIPEQYRRASQRVGPQQRQNLGPQQKQDLGRQQRQDLRQKVEDPRRRFDRRQNEAQPMYDIPQQFQQSQPMYDVPQQDQAYRQQNAGSYANGSARNGGSDPRNYNASYANAPVRNVANDPRSRTYGQQRSLPMSRPVSTCKT